MKNEQSKDNRKAPRLVRWLFGRLVKGQFHEELLGDLEEMYQERLVRRGRLFARLMYTVDFLQLLVGFASFKADGSRSSSVHMTGHYLQVAFRNLSRNRTYAVINTLSLAVGMGVCLVIFQYIYFELSYDNFHDRHENLYRVVVEEQNTDLKETYPTIGYAFAEAAKAEIPEVIDFIRKERFNRGAVVANTDNQQRYHEDINDLLFVDPSFFDVFNFPLKHGSLSSLFNDKYNVVITQETAYRYFDQSNPIGKTLKIQGPPCPGEYTVSGVLEDLPLNSHWQFDFLMPMANYLEYGWGGAVKKQGGWNGFSVVTYFRLEPTADVDEVREKLNTLIARHRPAKNPDAIIKEVILQPINEVYLKSGVYSDPGFINATGDIQNISAFSAVALLILVIAWVNYVNLSTAQAMKRIKEVGVRKSIGALRGNLIRQFMMEAFLLNVISGLAAIVFAYFVLPTLDQILDKQISFDLIQLPAFWIGFLVVIVLGTLISGLYPAFIMSGYKPISMVGASKNNNAGSIKMRRGLLSVQFFVSLMLIASTYLMYKQVSFMRNQELSIDLEKILVLRVQHTHLDRLEARSNFQAFRNEILQYSDVSGVTSSLATAGSFWVNSYRRSDQPETVFPHSRSIYAGLGFSDTYDLEFLAGGPFTEAMEEGQVLIINESSMRAFDFESPESALMQNLVIKDKERTIVGVVKDFDWHSLKEAQTPYIITFANVRLHPNLSLKLNLSDVSGTIKHIQSVFQSFYPDQPFEYYFADEAFDKQYQSEVQFGNLFFYFSGLSIFIACVGLFALASYSCSLRIKEMGIRKVHGANVFNLLKVLLKEYTTLFAMVSALS
ncbi:MAG: ABC transporter permease, partial [Bacteroidota bacterium]